jgi:hypothetical protein
MIYLQLTILGLFIIGMIVWAIVDEDIRALVVVVALAALGLGLAVALFWSINGVFDYYAVPRANSSTQAQHIEADK